MTKKKHLMAQALTICLLWALYSTSALASNGASVTYYGVENDPDHSTSANETAKAVETLSNSGAAKIAVKQKRTGEQILQDLNQLVTDHGENGRLRPGLFVFHYSGHGAAQAGGPGVIGLPTGTITTDQLVDRLLQVVGENTTVLILDDSCGAGNLKNSLDSRVRNEDGRRLNYYAVMGTGIMGPGETVCPRQGVDSMGAQVAAALEKDADGKYVADANKDGQLSVKELGEYVKAHGDGFSDGWAAFDYEGEPAHLDTAVNNKHLVNGTVVTPRPTNAERSPTARSSSSDSIGFDAATQSISFLNHFISTTGFDGDPMQGAWVSIPTMGLRGQISATEYLFEASDPLFSVADGAHEYLSGQLPQLVYDSSTDEFAGRISDLSFAYPGSDWIRNTGALFDPLSSSFDPSVNAFFTYKSAENWLNSTEGLGQDSTIIGSDGIRIASVAEPGTWWLVAASLLILVLTRQRQRGRTSLGPRMTCKATAVDAQASLSNVSPIGRHFSRQIPLWPIAA